MGWFIFGVIFFIVALFISCASKDDAFLVWCLCLISIIAIILGLSQIPTAMDLHAGKAVIKYEVVDGVKVDSTFVFKDE